MEAATCCRQAINRESRGEQLEKYALLQHHLLKNTYKSHHNGNTD